MQHTTGPQNNHGISHSLPCTCLNETLDVKDLKAREQQLKKKETALKKQQLELQEQTEQLVLLKSLQNSTEEKLNNANEEIRLLKIKLLALEEVHANGSSQYFKQTHENESTSRNDLNDLCTKMATMAIANLANNMSNNAPSPQSAQCDIMQQSMANMNSKVTQLAETVERLEKQMTGTWSKSDSKPSTQNINPNNHMYLESNRGSDSHNWRKEMYRKNQSNNIQIIPSATKYSRDSREHEIQRRSGMTGLHREDDTKDNVKEEMNTHDLTLKCDSYSNNAKTVNPDGVKANHVCLVSESADTQDTEMANVKKEERNPFLATESLVTAL